MTGAIMHHALSQTGHVEAHANEDPTAMFAMPKLGKGASMGVGAGVGGMAAFATCNSKCPGGAMGAAKGLMGKLNPLNLLPESMNPMAAKKEEEASLSHDEKMMKKMDYVEKELCNMNCKLVALMGAGAGAGAGMLAHKKFGAKPAVGPPPMGPGGYAHRGTLDEWTTAPFFVLSNQIDSQLNNVHRQVDEVEKQLQKARQQQAASKPQQAPPRVVTDATASFM
eukprot:TRINITY_DN39947_c0_g1_i1.p1 TRINITY_DN39947_c0_g1~~TRINITY_DN39947_c0_g1_i1.p1  ORF type:complete len:224 (+),score=65.51 TRINITY_DN39947_c0_g1_i1:138-809(+)